MATVVTGHMGPRRTAKTFAVVLSLLALVVLPALPGSEASYHNPPSVKTSTLGGPFSPGDTGDALWKVNNLGGTETVTVKMEHDLPPGWRVYTPNPRWVTLTTSMAYVTFQHFQVPQDVEPGITQIPVRFTFKDRPQYDVETTWNFHVPVVLDLSINREFPLPIHAIIATVTGTWANGEPVPDFPVRVTQTPQYNNPFGVFTTSYTATADENGVARVSMGDDVGARTFDVHRVGAFSSMPGTLRPDDVYYGMWL